MFNKYFLSIIVALTTQSCNAKNPSDNAEKIKIGEGSDFFFSSMYPEDKTLNNKDDIKNLLSSNWFENIDVKDKKGNKKSLNNCNELLEKFNDYSEIKSSDYSDIIYRKMYCMSVKYIFEAPESNISYLPKDIVFQDSPSILPKEFIPIYSQSDEEVVKAMPSSARWASGVKIDEVNTSKKGRAIFYQVEQDQILTELARADFNNDGIEDALLYLRTKINGGSHETNKIYTVTAGEDGVIKTLDIYPNDD